VSLAHKLAVASDLITADMVSAGEFPHLVNKYRVMAVPKTVINDEIQFEGTQPETALVDEVLMALDLEKDS
jgi:hypothetical protein